MFYVADFCPHGDEIVTPDVIRIADSTNGGNVFTNSGFDTTTSDSFTITPRDGINVEEFDVYDLVITTDRVVTGDIIMVFQTVDGEVTESAQVLHSFRCIKFFCSVFQM